MSFPLPTPFSNILTGAESSFQKVAAEVDADYKKVVALYPVVGQVAEAEASALKQQLSNAFAFVDTDLKPHYADAVSMVEAAADTLLLAHAGPVALPATAGANAGIQLGFDLLRSVLDRAEIAAKAKLQLPPPTANAAPSVAAVEGAAANALKAAAPLG